MLAHDPSNPFDPDTHFEAIWERVCAFLARPYVRKMVEALTLELVQRRTLERSEVLAIPEIGGSPESVI